MSCILQRGSTRQRNGDHSKLDISAGGKASPASCHDNLQRGSRRRLYRLCIILRCQSRPHDLYASSRQGDTTRAPDFSTMERNQAGIPLLGTRSKLCGRHLPQLFLNMRSRKNLSEQISCRKTAHRKRMCDASFGNVADQDVGASR